jgi:hypothetical protein
MAVVWCLLARVTAQLSPPWVALTIHNSLIVYVVLLEKNVARIVNWLRDDGSVRYWYNRIVRYQRE